MASALGLPVSAGFAPQNLDAPVPATVKQSQPARSRAMPPKSVSRKKLRRDKAPRAKSLKRGR